jgi:hypothetical protein
MTQVVFKRTGQPAVDVKATFDGKKLQFDADGKAVANVAGDDDYPFTWFAMGTQGASWSIEMTQPAAWGFKITKKLPPGGKDSNSEWIYVP